MNGRAPAVFKKKINPTYIVFILNFIFTIVVYVTR
jgi:hypothetical protein